VITDAPRPSTLTAILFGTIGGFTTMLANAGGPAWQMRLLSQRLDKFTYVGTFAILFAASDVLKIPAYGALGLHRCASLGGARSALGRTRSSARRCSPKRLKDRFQNHLFDRACT
jgi:hypothetical protein